MAKKSPKTTPTEYTKTGMKSGDILLGKIIECIDGERCKLVETWSRAYKEDGKIRRREFSKVDIKELGDNDEANIEYMKNQSRMWGIPSSVDVMGGGGRVFISRGGDVDSMMVYKDRSHLCKTKIKIRRQNHVICIPDTEMEKHSKSSKNTLNYIVSHPITKAVIRSMFEIYNVPDDVYVVMLTSDAKYDTLSPPGGYYAMDEMSVNITLNSILATSLESKSPEKMHVSRVLETVVHECIHLAESQSGLTYAGQWKYMGGRPVGSGSEMIASRVSRDIVDYLYRYDWDNVSGVIVNVLGDNLKIFIENYYPKVKEISDSLSHRRLVWSLNGIFLEDEKTNSAKSKSMAISFMYEKPYRENLVYVMNTLVESGHITDYELREMSDDYIDPDMGMLFLWIEVYEKDYNKMLSGVYFDNYL